LTAAEFEKTFLKSDFISKTCGLKRIDLTIVFQKSTGNEKFIDFFGFNKLLWDLKAKCDNIKATSDLSDFLG